MKEIKNFRGPERRIGLSKMISLVGHILVLNQTERSILFHITNLTKKKTDAILQFHSLDTVQREHDVIFYARCLGVTDYQPSAARLKTGSAKLQALVTAKHQVNTATEEIPMQDFSTKNRH